jgi:hypothetical protein
MSTVEQAAAEAFFRSTVDRKARCVVCGKDKREARAAGTRLQAHHVLSQQALKRRGLHELLWDPRNGVPTCEYPCHSNHTSAYRRIPRAVLPPNAEEFAAELGLQHILEAQYA